MQFRATCAYHASSIYEIVPLLLYSLFTRGYGFETNECVDMQIQEEDNQKEFAVRVR